MVRGETDCAGATVVCQGNGAVELFANVLGYGGVEMLFLGRQFVSERVGDTLGEKGLSVEFEQFFFDHAAHEVGDIDVVNAIGGSALRSDRCRAAP